MRVRGIGSKRSLSQIGKRCLDRCQNHVDRIADAHAHVVDHMDGKRQTGVCREIGADGIRPIDRDKRTTITDGIAVILLGQKMFHNAAAQGGAPPDVAPRVHDRDGHQAQTARLQRACDLARGASGVKHMFEDVLGDDDIEDFIGKSLVFQILVAPPT